MGFGIYDENIKTLRILSSTILNEQENIYSKGQSKKDKEFKLLKQGTDFNKGLLIGSALPATITTVETLAGAIGLLTTSKNSFNQLFYANGINTLINLSLPSGVYLFSKISSNVSRSHKYDGLYFTDKNARKLYENDSTLCLIRDLMKDSDDSSLSFAREFLSNVSITKNDIEFNEGLMAHLADCRDTVKYELYHGLVPTKSVEAKMDLASYMRTNAKKASGAFNDSIYVNYFLRNMLPEKYKSEEKRLEKFNRKNK